MFITIVAVVCRLASPGACSEQIVTNSDLDPDLSLQSCMIGEAAIVKWMKDNPRFAIGYRLERWKCVPGHYFPKDAI
jgi:hypothetical protein